MLDLVARHPATARFIATKLARRFVSDDPPPALVERLARVFTETDGDLKALVVALFESPEMWSRDAYRSKIKMPFEFAVSAVRALGGHVDNAGGLAGALGKMGQPLYRCQPPTGYKDAPATWVNTGALIARLNFGLALAQGKLGGTHVHVQPLGADLFSLDPSPAVARAGQLVLHDELAAGSRDVILAELAAEDRSMADGEVRQLDLPRVVGMLLGTPEFQRR